MYINSWNNIIIIIITTQCVSQFSKVVTCCCGSCQGMTPITKGYELQMLLNDKLSLANTYHDITLAIQHRPIALLELSWQMLFHDNTLVIQ